MQRSSLLLGIFVIPFILTCSSAPKGPNKTELQAGIQIKTLDSDAVVTTVAVSSSANPKLPQPMWNTILKVKPDLFVGTGNNLTARDSKPMSPADNYRVQGFQPEFVKFRSVVPMIATWDNSDFGTLGPKKNGVNSPEKETSKLEYLKFYGNDSSVITARQSGIYHSFLLGTGKKTVQVIVLDLHSFRTDLETVEKIKFPHGPYTPSKSKDATLLGDAQWRWLETQLHKPAAERIIVSSAQFISDKHGFESWGNFPLEKERLLKMFRTLKVGNVVVLSGNRAHGEMNKIKYNKNNWILDITAGGLNVAQGFPDEASSTRLGPIVNEPNFATLATDWDKKKLRIQLQDINGKVLHEELVSL